LAISSLFCLNCSKIIVESPVTLPNAVPIIMVDILKLPKLLVKPALPSFQASISKLSWLIRILSICYQVNRQIFHGCAAAALI
jgi:hypothetical protein